MEYGFIPVDVRPHVTCLSYVYIISKILIGSLPEQYTSGQRPFARAPQCLTVASKAFISPLLTESRTHTSCVYHLQLQVKIDWCSS